MGPVRPGGSDTSGPGPDVSRERMEAWVRGRVQGVGFRVFVAREAWRLGLVGWVRNEADGTVHVVAQGEPVDLDALLDALHEGPMGADVREVRATRGPTTATLTDFDIRAGGHLGD